jgi:nitrogen regulatory protein PII
MDSRDGNHDGITLICAILNHGHGSRALHIAKQNGVRGGTIFYGEGTVKNRVLEFLALSDVKKEIVLLFAESDTAYRALDALQKELKLHKPNHGIAFTIRICEVIGSKAYDHLNCLKERGGDPMSEYQAITVIVDRGKAEEVIAAAESAGSKGGTVIRARGSGIHETSKVFSMEIEPEKEIVLILAKYDVVEPIISVINKKLMMDEPGNGIIFVQNVEKTVGLME